MKKIIFLIIVLVVLITADVFYLFHPIPLKWYVRPANIISIQDKQITDNTKPFVIKIVYPYISGLDDFNQKVKAIIGKEISDFKTNSLANDEAVKKVDPAGYAKYSRTYELDISYYKGEIDNNIISVVFNVYNFEGGAHGASYFVPLNYDVKTKKEIALANLFPGQSDYLQKISAFCIADLTKQITTSLEGNIDEFETNWINDGAGPKVDNFQYFLINPSTDSTGSLQANSRQATLTFYFPQYQVAPGAAGEFQVTMPR